MMSNKLILLAEDNLVNQKVTLRQLEKLGYTADVVSDGFMALDALLRASYDLVLMDCQMPEMDGYETTAEIRRREATTRHTPIIAMTAHALEGDREKCLAAGMDDYISKPVKYEELGKVLAEWLPDAPNADEVSGSSAQAALPPVDMERLFCAMGDDPEEMQEILDIYLEQMAESVQKLSAAVEAGDAVQLKLVAHNCAGVSANCGMTALVAPLRELERRGREGWIGDTAQLLKQISQELARTKLFLQEQLGQLTFG